jgi:hypothetical protein
MFEGAAEITVGTWRRPQGRTMSTKAIGSSPPSVHRGDAKHLAGRGRSVDHP